MTDKTEQERRETVKDLVKDAKICMFTSMTDDGRHQSRPMTVQEVEFDGDLWFFAYADSDVIAQIRSNPQVNVAFQSGQHAWASVSGSAQQVDDRGKAKELWNQLLRAWFPDGLDTPGLTLIKVTTQTAEYWESAHSKAVTLLGYARRR